MTKNPHNKYSQDKTRQEQEQFLKGNESKNKTQHKMIGKKTEYIKQIQKHMMAGKETQRG